MTWRRNWEGRDRDIEVQRFPLQANHLCSDRDLGAGQGQKRGECTFTGNIVRRRHAVRGAGTSGKGWWVAGAGDVQVGGNSHQERTWGAVEKQEGFNNEQIRMGRG